MERIKGAPTVAEVVLELHDDGTVSAFHPIPGEENGMGLARGDLRGALAFAEEQLKKHGAQ